MEENEFGGKMISGDLKAQLKQLIFDYVHEEEPDPDEDYMPNETMKDVCKDLSHEIWAMAFDEVLPEVYAARDNKGSELLKEYALPPY